MPEQDTDAVRREVADQISAAIAACETCRNRLKKGVLNGLIGRSAAEINDELACQFGKWISAYEPTFGDRRHVDRVNRAHERFHRAAGDVAGSIERADLVRARAILETGAFSRSRREFVGCLTEWQENL